MLVRAAETPFSYHARRGYFCSIDTTTTGVTAGIDGVLYQRQEWYIWDVTEASRQCLEWPLQIETEESYSEPDFMLVKVDAV